MEEQQKGYKNQHCCLKPTLPTPSFLQAALDVLVPALANGINGLPFPFMEWAYHGAPPARPARVYPFVARLKAVPAAWAQASLLLESPRSLSK